MAYLIKCSVCENEISFNAEVCLYCGEPDPKPIREKFSWRKFFGKDEEVSPVDWKDTIEELKEELKYYDDRDPFPEPSVLGRLWHIIQFIFYIGLLSFLFWIFILITGI